jgi:Transposase DDE domain
MLCLMRDEDWTFREAEVRLAEHCDLRAALGLTQASDFTTLYRLLSRLDDAVMEQALTAALRQLPAPPEECSTTVAVDVTGLAPGAIITFCVKRARDYGAGFTRRHWLKWMVAVDIGRRLVVAQAARCGPYKDCATLRPLVEAASQRVPIGLVLADAAFDSERNHQYIRHHIGADRIMPAKRGKADWHMTGMRAHMRQQFPAERCRQRALAESLFSSVKRELSARAPGRSIHTQRMQALLLGLAYDIYRL